MVDRIRNTSILGYALIIEIDLTCCVNGNVLKKCVSLDCAVDVRLMLFIKADNLSIATTFKVEYAVVIPAVLVVTDKETLGIC